MSDKILSVGRADTLKTNLEGVPSTIEFKASSVGVSE